MNFLHFLIAVLTTSFVQAQFNFNYNFSTTGRRVCLAEATVSTTNPSLTISLLDHFANTTETYTIKRRILNGSHLDWTTLVSNLPASTQTWTDTNVTLGSIFEYQIRRTTSTGDAIIHITIPVLYDQSNYKGAMILAIDTSLQTSLATEITQLKKDLTNEGWRVIELFLRLIQHVAYIATSTYYM